MKSNLEVYRALVQDTLQYLQDHFVRKTISDSPVKQELPAKIIPTQIAIEKPVLTTVLLPEQKPLPTTQVLPSLELKAWLLKQKIPLHFTEEIPDDQEAKKQAELWKHSHPIAILYFNENSEDLIFLKKLKQAIHASLVTTKLFDARKIIQEDKWEPFFRNQNWKLIISASNELKNVSHFRENRETKQCFLGDIPVLFLLPIREYKKIQLKKQLWSEICQWSKQKPSSQSF